MDRRASDEVKGLILAWDDAVRFIRENPEEGGKIIADAVGAKMEEFTPAFEGVRLYTLPEIIAFVEGDFAATVQDIGEIMLATNPENIKTVPTMDQLMSTDILMSLK